MCFSPKISTPKPSTAAPEPAPLSEEVASVDIGAEAESDADTKETKGISDLKVKKESAPKDKSSVSRAMRASGVNMG